MRAKNLGFRDFDEVVERLDLLLEHGYDRIGSWSLGQNCNHLATLMEFSQRASHMWIGSLSEKVGFPLAVMYFARTVGWLGLRIPTLPFAQQEEPVDEDAGVERLKLAIGEQLCRVNAKACNTFQLWHCGHHLDFLTPLAERSPAQHDTRLPSAANQSI